MPTIRIDQFLPGNFRFDIYNPGLAQGMSITSVTSTLITLTGGNRVTTVSGTGFTTDGSGNVNGGTISSIDFNNNNQLTARLTNMAQDATAFFSAVSDAQTGNFGPLNAIYDAEPIEYFATNLTQGFAHTYGGAQNDTFNGSATQSVGVLMEGYDGADTYVGNTGYDHVSYANETGPTGIFVNLVVGGSTDSFGNPETFFGSIDRIDGSARGDTIIGGSNSEWIEGLAGNDTLDGGLGFDTLGYGSGRFIGATAGVMIDVGAGTASDGFGGTDTFSNFEAYFGSILDDTITGGAGDDTITGSGGVDMLDGGAGRDRLNFDWAPPGAGTNGVTVNLATGAVVDLQGNNETAINFEDVGGTPYGDTITGSDVGNFLIGDAGNDTIFGGGGDDRIDGGDGDDIIDPGTSDSFDQIVGSSGNDRIIFTNTDNFQFLGYSALPENYTVNVNAPGNLGSVVKGALGTDTFTDVFRAVDNVGPGRGGLGFYMGGGNDTFNVTGTANGFLSVRGAGGTDVYNLNGGYLRLELTGGTQSVNVNLATGQIANDGYGFAETINGTVGELRLSANTDTAVGTSGDDRFITEGGNDTVNGGAGTDRARYDRNGAEAVNVDLENQTATGSWQGTAFTQTLISIENVTGSYFDDVIKGSNSVANLLKGDRGNDRLTGGSGDDILNGGDGFDTAVFNNGIIGVVVNLTDGTAIDGSQDNDQLISIENVEGTFLADTITGDGGSNYLVGGEGGDTINGGGTTPNDWDRIEGNDGNDELTIIGLGEILGGSGDDTVRGVSSGNTATGDYVIASYRDAPNGIIANLTGTMQMGVAGGDNANGFNISDGHGNTDDVAGVHVVQGSAHDDHYFGDTVYQNSFGSFLSFMPGSGDDTMSFTNSAGATIGRRVSYTDMNDAISADMQAGTATDRGATTSIGNDTFTGANQIRGSRGDDLIFGKNGDDARLRGHDGDDTINGRGGNDLLEGERGNDTLNGDEGNDRLDGGEGADAMTGGTGNDIYIVDNVGDTVTELAGGGDDSLYSSVSFTLPDHVEVAFVTGVGTAGNEMLIAGNNSSNFLFGGSGADILQGFGGSDYMAGGAGNDVYSVDSSIDAVVENAGEGFDNVYSSVDFIIDAAQEIESAILTGNAVTLRGSNSDNQLFGNDQINVIDGRGGTDFMLGQGGADIFQITPEAGAVDVIGDFSKAEGDRIAFAGFNATSTTVTQVSAVSFEVRDTMGTADLGDDTVQQFILNDSYGSGAYTQGALQFNIDYYFG